MIPRYVVTAALRLTVLSSGRLAAADSMWRAPRELGPEALPILLAFARPASIDEALASVRRDHDMDRGAFVGWLWSGRSKSRPSSYADVGDATNLYLDEVKAIAKPAL